ncbi:MAG TPA: glutamate racemase [Caldisericia bacterium]|nr:glutamate racemase [Caldisericia bacterium]
MSKIGIFDSGIGGLSVLKVIYEKFPNNIYFYIGDENYYPYGLKSDGEIIDRSEKITEFLISQKVDLIIVACNTVSSIALDHLKKKYEVPIIGVIDGAVEKSLKITKNGLIGVISTPLTANTHIYRDKILSKDSKVKVYEVGSQELVNIVENGIINNDPTYLIAKETLEKIKFVDTLILGCTHFPALQDLILKILPDVKIVDPAKEIIKYIKNYIDNKDKSVLEFYTTGDINSFKEKAKIFIKDFEIEVKRILI